MPRFSNQDLDEEIIAHWNAITKSEQPDEPRNPKDKITDVFDLIFNTK